MEIRAFVSVLNNYRHWLSLFFLPGNQREIIRARENKQKPPFKISPEFCFNFKRFIQKYEKIKE